MWGNHQYECTIYYEGVDEDEQDVNILEPVHLEFDLTRLTILQVMKERDIVPADPKMKTSFLINKYGFT